MWYWYSKGLEDDIQNDFPDWKCSNVYQVTWGSTAPSAGLAPYQWQAITWLNDDQVLWCSLAWLGRRVKASVDPTQVASWAMPSPWRSSSLSCCVAVLDTCGLPLGILVSVYGRARDCHRRCFTAGHCGHVPCCQGCRLGGRCCVVCVIGSGGSSSGGSCYVAVGSARGGGRQVPITGEA